MSLPPALCKQLDVLLIDNFDSFTWNLYQQLCLLGAEVTVIRNDAITAEQFPELQLNSLIISPGPGHPKTDSGISRDAIEYFKGKVPVLGVCMGLECMVDVFGGDIAYAGEIMHGKVSRILHDERGCFKGIQQGIKSTRYHSLSAAHTTLPAELAITATTDDSGVIMGVRHRQYTLEAVQPRGGGKKIPSVLEKIYHQRLADVTQAQATPGSTLADLETLYALNVAPPLLPLLPRLTARPALFAEVKRASPSKGLISADDLPCEPGADPKWFLGSLQDMLHARLSVATLPDRPAILRKDFIFSRYQVLESRIWGADTILLIVGLLPEVALRDLYAYSLELGMEPLVEVNNAREMDLALSLPAKVIGVNNRNLHDFRGKGVVLCALSGITSAADVSRYAGQGPSAPLVKICGVRTKDEALAIAGAGADMLGLMFVESSKRHVPLDTAREICASIRALRFSRPPPPPPPAPDNAPWFASHAARLSSLPLVVGVFQNQPLREILHAVSACQLDAVQLHGSEPVEWARQIPVPVIKAFHAEAGITRPGYHHFVLLDSLRD
ncbi:anthranilate synthase [Armillaria mellea]|nr:anthranilate synthase [Armillaria mellea]